VSTGEGPPALRYLNVGALIGAAGGSPWQVNASLQSGEPAEIDGLAQAFHNAAACTRNSDDEFLAAKLRFEASWNRDQGDHPINDSAEVRRATLQSSFLRTQLPSVGTDLEGIAAALAAAQRFAAPLITNLNTQLQYLDALIGQALAANATQADIDQLQREAEQVTAGILHEVQAIRATYSQTLDEALTKPRGVDGYAPEILDGIDADGKPAVDDKTHAAADQYNRGQRAADQALVDSGGAQTQQMQQDSAARLRDFGTATVPTPTRPRAASPVSASTISIRPTARGHPRHPRYAIRSWAPTPPAAHANGWICSASWSRETPSSASPAKRPTRRPPCSLTLSRRPRWWPASARSKVWNARACRRTAP
jgi:hypothetical protein